MPTEKGERALVLFSGGQDSTTCLAWALAHYTHVETIGFDYGQRHGVELKQRPILREKLAAAQRGIGASGSATITSSIFACSAKSATPR